MCVKQCVLTIKSQCQIFQVELSVSSSIDLVLNIVDSNDTKINFISSFTQLFPHLPHPSSQGLKLYMTTWHFNVDTSRTQR